MSSQRWEKELDSTSSYLLFIFGKYVAWNVQAETFSLKFDCFLRLAMHYNK